jgi:ATP-binding cassette, subfamily B, bacterial MsbA
MRTPTSVQTHDEDLKRRLDWSSITRLLALANPYRKVLAAAGVLVLLSTAIQLAMPVLIQSAVRSVRVGGGIASFDQQALVLVALVLFGAAIAYVRFQLSARAGNRIVRDLRLKMFSHLLTLPVAYFDRIRSGDISSHLSNDVSQLQLTLTDDLVQFAGNIVLLVGGIGLAVWMNWQLTIVVVSLLVAVMAFFVTFGRRLRQLTRKALDALSEAMGTMTESLSNVRAVKSFAREQYESKMAEHRLDVVFGFSMDGAKWEGVMGAIGGAGFTSMLIGVGWFGGRAVISGTMRVEDLIGFVASVFIISQPMAQLASLYTRLQRSVGAAERVFQILDEPSEPSDADSAEVFPNGPGHVAFQDVHFSYVPENPVFQGLSFDIPAGKVTALVGPSGAGKTTVASLLFRLYEPTQGQITIDGVPIAAIRRQSLREAVGIVPQDTILFNGTIRENIRYGRLTATDAEIEDAAKEANVHQFVMDFADGYETMIGERGVTLSGGQRQRVAIARAVLKNPRILILDEATSALDSRSEDLVKEALDRLMSGRTTLVIAHRLSTIRDADVIAVLVGGKITEIGKHEELLGQGGVYADLYRTSKGEEALPA